MRTVAEKEMQEPIAEKLLIRHKNSPKCVESKPCPGTGKELKAAKKAKKTAAGASNFRPGGF
jgi:hypothetical protein